MGCFYFDESIQHKGGFIIGAFVYSKADLTPLVFEALADAGLRPGVDEFKSSARMCAAPEQVKVRTALSDVFHDLKTGIVITRDADRPLLGQEALLCLEKLLRVNFPAEMRHEVYIDQGIRIAQQCLETFRKGAGSLCEMRINQDSRVVCGIQLADLAAHSMGIMLLEHQGLLNKKVRAGENSGYDPDSQIELGFELWAMLRYSFFKAPQPKPGPIPDDPVGELMFDVENYGLHIADSCDGPLRKAALQVFGECYLGCIH